MLRGLFTAAADPRQRKPAHTKWWKLWCEFARRINQHPYLADLQSPADHVERVDVFLAFAVALRKGHLGDRQPASGSAITTTLRECAKVLHSRGFADPRRRHPSDHGLDPAIKGFLSRCCAGDPSPERQLALPASTVRLIASADTALGSQQDVTKSLVVLAFYFLLRVGEYTDSRETRHKLTVALRRCDVKLWIGDRRLPIDAPWHTLETATGVSITLENQKNGHKGCVLHHGLSADPTMCPVKAMIRILHACRDMPDTTKLGTYRLGTRTARVSAREIRTCVKNGAISDGLLERGYDLSRIGSHSLRSGGAVALKLAGHDSDVIKKLGRWSSDTYLLYIQSQIAQLTAHVAASITTRLRFLNVG